MQILSKTISCRNTQSIFIPIILIVQISLVTVITWSMGWWIMDKSTSWCSIFSLMVDERTDVATIEKLSIFWRWVENGSPIEHFMEIFSLKKAWCWINLFSIDWLAQDEECTVSQACTKIVDVWNRKPRRVAV